MSGWTAKRFWSEVTTAPVEGGYGLFLDGRPVKTPAKSTVVVPTPILADAMADEWRAVEEVIDPNTMPMTRSANAAIDKVATQFAEVAEMIAAYGASDLLCYRAESPEALCQRQADGWDPLLDWAESAYNARLNPVAGLMPIAQEDAAVARLRTAVHAQTPFQLTALHDLVAISGSLILGLAVTRGRLTGEQAWALSRIDEDWQVEQWGEDEEASAMAAHKREALLHAERLYAMAS